MADTGDKKVKDMDLGDGDRSFDAAGFFGDRKKSHRLGCTCTTLIILLIITLAVLVILVILASRTSVELPNSLKTSSTTTSSSIAKQIDDALKDKDNSAVIVINEDEINSVLGGSQTKVSIEPEVMYVAGQTFGFNTLSEVEPKVQEGQLAFDVKSVKVGSLPVPKILAAPVLGEFNSSLRKANKELAVINFTSVEKQQGALLLTGKVVGR